jgi:polyvinyl alcohol dehydrogenase (cytochrome)
MRSLLTTALLFAVILGTPQDCVAEGMQADVHGLVVPETLNAADRGAALYIPRCAGCHDHPQNNVPPRASLAYRSPEAIAYALAEGAMKPMTKDLAPADIEALVVLLSGRKPRPLPDPMAAACKPPASTFAVADEDWNGNGGSHANTRYRDYGWLSATTVPRLQLAWSFGYPGGAGGPAVLGGGRVFLPAGFGFVLSLDADTGCVRWAFRRPGRVVRSLAISGPTGKQQRPAVYFGDDQTQVTALDAITGEQLWQARVETNVLSRITGSPSVYAGKVLVPVSSIEDPMTHVDSHACCSSRGGVVALDAATGKILWQQQHITGALRDMPADGTDRPAQRGPAGAATYVPLAVDERRGLVYASTAEEYGRLDPPGPYSVIAYDIATGERRWAQQFLPKGAEREAACAAIGETDCRNVFSMGTAPLIHTFPDGHQLLLAGQKWGYVYAMDPDDGGRVLWRSKVASGGDMGGVIYGLASDGERIYVPVSDVDATEPGRAGSLLALDPATGKTLWRRDGPAPECNWTREGCTAAQVAAVSAVPGAVFGGFNDGWLRAFSTQDGSPLFRFDTARTFETVNGIPARGGQVSGYPVVIGRDALFVTSGASSVERPGNVLLVFKVE